MDDQLNIILQDDIVTNWTLETHLTRVFHSFDSVENESYLTTIISVVGEWTVATRDAPVPVNWVPVGLGPSHDWVPVLTGCQSDWMPVRLGTK